MPLFNSSQSEVASPKPTGLERNPAQLSKFEKELIAIFVELMQALGFPKSYGEIYGLLYATPDPLGFAEIHKRLSLSKGSVSGGLKALKEIGAIKSVASDDGRRERFEPQLELKKLVLAYLRDRLQPQLESNTQRIQHLETVLNESQAPSTQRKVLQSRLGKLEKWRHKANGIVPWVVRFLN